MWGLEVAESELQEISTAKSLIWFKKRISLKQNKKFG
jgi:hypothetical protein